MKIGQPEAKRLLAPINWLWGECPNAWTYLAPEDIPKSLNDNPTKFWRLRPFCQPIPRDLAPGLTIRKEIIGQFANRGVGILMLPKKRWGEVRADDTPLMLVLNTHFGYDPSGPTIDTIDTQRCAAVHDALYQMIRHGLLPKSARKAADAFLRRLMRLDAQTTGAGFRRFLPWRRRWFRRNVRAPVWWLALRLGGGGAIRPVEAGD